MKQVNLNNRELGGAKTVKVAPPPPLPPPPPPPPFRRSRARKAIPDSVTKQEIANFWRRKHIEEEDHFLAAIKAIARIKARNLSEEDYKFFEESLMDDHKEAMEKSTAAANDGDSNKIGMGRKNWWTESNHAYLNQQVIESGTPLKRTYTYVPNCFPYKPTPLHPTSLGVF